MVALSIREIYLVKFVGIDDKCSVTMLRSKLKRLEKSEFVRTMRERWELALTWLSDDEKVYSMLYEMYAVSIPGGNVQLRYLKYVYAVRKLEVVGDGDVDRLLLGVMI